MRTVLICHDQHPLDRDGLDRLIGPTCWIPSKMVIEECFDKLCGFGRETPSVLATINGDKGFFDSFFLQCGIKEFRLIE